MYFEVAGKSREEGHTMTHTAVGTPKQRGKHHWFVPSGKFGYHVRWAEGRYHCTCPSKRWRPHLACKHIEAVRRQRKAVNMG
jgi:hypothetical protein